MLLEPQKAEDFGGFVILGKLGFGVREYGEWLQNGYIILFFGGLNDIFGMD